MVEDLIKVGQTYKYKQIEHVNIKIDKVNKKTITLHNINDPKDKFEIPIKLFKDNFELLKD